MELLFSKTAAFLYNIKYDQRHIGQFEVASVFAFSKKAMQQSFQEV